MKAKTRFIGSKPKKGEGRTEYGEMKVNVNFSLTPTVKDVLTNAASTLGIPRSELLEKLGHKGEQWLIDVLEGSK